MIRKLFRTGNNVVVSLSQEMLDALQVGEGDEVSVELDREHGHVVIGSTHALAEAVDAEFAKQVADFIEEYRPALEALAR